MRRHLAVLAVVTCASNSLADDFPPEEQKPQKPSITRGLGTLFKRTAEEVLHPPPPKGPLAPRPRIERQLTPERRPTSTVACKHPPSPPETPDPLAPPVRREWGVPFSYLAELNEEENRHQMLVGRFHASFERFQGTVENGRREGPYLLFPDLEWMSGKWGSNTVRVGRYVGGVRSLEEQEYVSGQCTRVWTWQPDRKAATAIGKFGDVLTDRTYYRDGHEVGLEEHFFSDGSKKVQVKWANQRMVERREWSCDGSVVEETLQVEGGVSSQKWSGDVLVFDQHPGFRVTRFDNGFKQSEVIAADEQHLGSKRLWFDNGQPMLAIDLDEHGFQVGLAQHFRVDGSAMTQAEWEKFAKDRANQKAMELASTLLMIPISVLCALK